MRSLAAVMLTPCLLVLAAVSCGGSDGDGSSGNAAGQTSGGAQAGKGGESAAGKGGGATAGAAMGSAGSASGGNGNGGGAGNAGSPANGGDTSAGGEPSGDGGSGSDGFVDCDTRKVTCKIKEPVCPANEAPSVVGTCYGPCVRIDHCACKTAAECPNQNEYTCWMQQHCGPFVR